MTAAHGNAPQLATDLLALHQAPEILTVVNCWDVVSAKVAAGTEGTRALATASHSIAATLGYPDGEQIPVEEMLDMCGRIAAAVDVPVSADLEGGYGDAPETIRKAIGLGIVGANIEDQLKPLAEAAAQVEAIMAVAEREGVPDFVLNARTDAFVMAGDRDPVEVLADAIARGKAYLDAGAPVVFVPGRVGEAEAAALIDAFGARRLSLICTPVSLTPARMAELGVARVSFGPFAQRVALTAYQQLIEGAQRGEGLPGDVRPLN
ncbi:isocitrate lyase/phosphoenolpyruvate mutase family protein [Nocardioides bigeumensis]|uniref:Isocitrate lyase/phosphoenolpyruvate mutase family protein n=1 Tax=Nocardioides bigeumensis TaxID=433657 RepID=A0ABN2XPG3_9ACTN